MYPAELIELLIYLLGGALCIAVGYFACWWRNCRNHPRADYLRGCTDTERLFMERIAQDRRDDAPLSQPVTR